MILVTGATGFIGSYVVARLHSLGHEVLAASRYRWRPESPWILADELPELVRFDMRDADQVVALLRQRRPDAVIHLDAFVDPVALRRDPLRAMEFNACPVLNLLEACRAVGVARFVLASSVAVLPEIRSEPITAAHPIVTERGGPAGGFYGVAKAVSEVITLGYASAFGLDVRIVRPSAVFGFGMQWPIGIKPVIEGLVDGGRVQIPAKAPPRDYTPVQDVAAIFAAVLECRQYDDLVFNAGTGRPLTRSEDLVAAVRAVFPNGGIEVTEEDLDPTGVESRYRGVLDMAPVREQLGVAPAFASLEEGLSAYADQYRRFVTGR